MPSTLLAGGQSQRSRLEAEVEKATRRGRLEAEVEKPKRATKEAKRRATKEMAAKAKVAKVKVHEMEADGTPQDMLGHFAKKEEELVGGDGVLKGLRKRILKAFERPLNRL